MHSFTRRFTLVEMLTVIAIISILAGLVIPVVVIAQAKGRETQAKSDISAIVSALKAMDADYGRMLKKSNSNYYIGNSKIDSGNLLDNKKINDSGNAVSDSNSLAKLNGNYYNAMIAELSAPKNTGLTVSVNTRKKIYLEPKKGFDPTANYDSTANTPFLWRDPWGNPYVIYLKVTGEDFMVVPDTAKNLASKIAVYSFGPNGADDSGCSNVLDACIKSSDNTAAKHKQHDDIASWDL